MTAVLSRRRLGGEALAVAVACLTACASPGAVPPTDRVTHHATEFVFVQPEATGLIEAADDGVHTYLEFSVVVPTELHVFTGQGERLETFASGSLLGIPGLHEGLLLRLGTATSFVSIRPGSRRGAVALGDSRELRDVRQALRTRTPEYQAMQRAIGRVAEREADTSKPRGGEAMTRIAPIAPGTGGAQAPRPGRLLSPTTAPISPP
jgi:hypothetical protein